MEAKDNYSRSENQAKCAYSCTLEFSFIILQLEQRIKRIRSSKYLSKQKCWTDLADSMEEYVGKLKKTLKEKGENGESDRQAEARRNWRKRFRKQRNALSVPVSNVFTNE